MIAFAEIIMMMLYTVLKMATFSYKKLLTRNISSFYEIIL